MHSHAMSSKIHVGQPLDILVPCPCRRPLPCQADPELATYHLQMSKAACDPHVPRIAWPKQGQSRKFVGAKPGTTFRSGKVA